MIGPGGVGKTTTAKYLAPRLGYDCIDLDDYFCERIENIRVFIANYGYREYVIANARCFHEIVQNCKRNTIISLSSGFLIIEEAAKVKQDRNRVRDEDRIEDVVAKVLAESDKVGLAREVAEPVWRLLIERSIAHEYVRFDAEKSAAE